MVSKVQGIKVSKYTMLDKSILHLSYNNNDKHVVAVIIDARGQTGARVYLIRHVYIHIQTIYIQHYIRDLRVRIKTG